MDNSKAMKIRSAIRERFLASDNNRIVLEMKSGNRVTIIREHTSTHYSGGAYVPGKCWYKVRQTEESDPRYFKTLIGIAKAMAYGYIK